MKTHSRWQAVVFAACLVVFGCSRGPQTVPERSAEAVPGAEPSIAALPPGEHSDPSLVDSAVTANLDVDAPWTDARSEAQQASARSEDDAPQTNARVEGEDRPADAPARPDTPAAATSSSAPAGDRSTLDVAKSSDTDGAMSTN